MAREDIKKVEQKKEDEEKELTPDEIADLLTNCCDNAGLS